MSLRHRNSLTECTLFFITTTVVSYLNVFRDYNACELLINNIKHYQQKYKFRILGFVIMPSHFHWIVEVNNKYGTISDIMRDIKKYSAWDIMQYLGEKNYKGLDRDSLGMGNQKNTDTGSCFQLCFG